MRAYKSAPGSVRAAVALFLLELLGILASGVVALRAHQFVPGAPDITLLAGISTFVILCLIATLAVGIIAGAHRRRRVIETYVFQGIVAVACVLSLPRLVSPWTIAYLIVALTIATLLSLPAARRYAADADQPGTTALR
jgi:hypothetical protein